MRTWNAMSLSSTIGYKRTTKRHRTCDAPSWTWSSWILGVLQQLWTDVSVRCPHAERYNESTSKTGVAAVAEEAEKTKRYGMAVRALVFETSGRLGSECTKLLRDLVTTAAGQILCFIKLMASSSGRDMLDDNQRANASLVRKYARRLATAATAVVFRRG